MKKIKLFLASSEELKEERIQFEAFIRRKNTRLVNQDLFLELQVWEDFLDVMSQQRLQDEYNKVIRSCHVFVLLFFTKVGKYTEEEFNTAFDQFKAVKSPCILTYCKDAQIATSSLNKRDTMSLFAFKQRLENLGHFPTTYDHVSTLLLHFEEQIQRILEQHSQLSPKNNDLGSENLDSQISSTSSFHYGGVIWEGDKTYVPRASDSIALKKAKNLGETLVILSPSKMGKTNLLHRYLWKSEEYGKDTCLINLSELAQSFSVFSDLLNGFSKLLDSPKFFLK